MNKTSTENRYDILGNIVNLGDDVIIIEPHYRNFTNGTLVKFTPTGFKVQYAHWNGTYKRETFVTELVKGKMKTEEQNDC